MPSRAAGKVSLASPFTRQPLVPSAASPYEEMPQSHPFASSQIISQPPSTSAHAPFLCAPQSHGASCANPAMTFTAYIANLPKSSAQILSRSRHHVLIRWMNTYSHTHVYRHPLLSLTLAHRATAMSPKTTMPRSEGMAWPRQRLRIYTCFHQLVISNPCLRNKP